MARIPMGNFGQVVPQAEQRRVITYDAPNRGAQELAASVQRSAAQLLDQRTQEEQALARVRASNQLLERESQISSITRDLDERLRTGELSPDQADSAYQSAVGALSPMTATGLGEAESEGFNLSLRKLQLRGSEALAGSIGNARIAGARNDLAARMDMLGKDAGMPGADPLAIINRMDQDDIETVGRMAYGVEWDAKKQDFKDSVFTNHASQQLVGAKDNLSALRNLQHQLSAEDGYYTSRLDAEKRTQLLNSVSSRISQVQEHHARQAEIAEVRALRILDQMDKQAASGVMPTVQDQQRWQAALVGTSAAGEFSARMQQMTQVQELLRMPLTEQQAFLQAQRASLAKNGGSVDQITLVNRLEAAVESNMKQMRDQPLEWNATRTGTAVEPLNFAEIGTPEGQAALSAQIAARMDTIGAMRNQIGPEVSRNPFLPQEASMLKAALAQADDNTKLAVVGAIAQAAPGANDFAGSLQAIAADDPSLMLAGMALAKGLKGPEGESLAPVILSGNRVLADKSAPMPSEEGFREYFDKEIGHLLAVGSTQREQAYLAFKTMYAGRVVPEGISHDSEDPEIKDELAKKALELATGGVSTISTGWLSEEKVLRPHGMSDDDFQTARNSQLEALAAASGIAQGSLKSMPMMPVQGADGAYYLLNGGRVQLDPKTNEPLIVRVR